MDQVDAAVQQPVGEAPLVARDVVPPVPAPVHRDHAEVAGPAACRSARRGRRRWPERSGRTATPGRPRPAAQRDGTPLEACPTEQTTTRCPGGPAAGSHASGSSSPAPAYRSPADRRASASPGGRRRRGPGGGCSPASTGPRRPRSGTPRCPGSSGSAPPCPRRPRRTWSRSSPGSSPARPDRRRPSRPASRPRPPRVDRAGHRAVALLGEMDVRAGVGDPALVERGVTRVGQDLVHSPARHHVPGQHQPGLAATRPPHPGASSRARGERPVWHACSSDRRPAPGGRLRPGRPTAPGGFACTRSRSGRPRPRTSRHVVRDADPDPVPGRDPRRVDPVPGRSRRSRRRPGPRRCAHGAGRAPARGIPVRGRASGPWSARPGAAARGRRPRPPPRPEHGGRVPVLAGDDVVHQCIPYDR